MWKYESLLIQLDITTYCNAKCPQCHRTNPKTLEKEDWLPLKQWTMEDFNKAFSDEDLRHIREIHFSPTWGDPVMNPFLYDMVERCFSVNRRIKITVSTNGSIQNEDWWWKFGNLAKNRFLDLTTIFAVDGTNQEMHSRYRVNTNLKKILNNMESYANSFYAKTFSQTIVFKHNQDHLEEIKQMCFDKGADKHINIISDRFQNEKIFSYKEGKLEKSNLDLQNKKNIHLNLNKNKIDCQWKNRNSININYDGQVHPCCYIGNPFPKAMILNEKKDFYFINHEVMQNYIETRNDMNIFNQSLKSILENGWFKQTLPNSWNKNPIDQCDKMCRRKDFSVEMNEEKINL